MTIRSFWKAVKIEEIQSPYDAVHLKIFYPCLKSTGKQQIFAPVNPENAPFPVVVFFSGGNCSLDNYQWLAENLGARGIITVLSNWVGEVLPGIAGLLPGTNLSSRKPDVYGSTPTAIILPPILKELENLNSNGVLAGALDLEKIILGGHSGGGRVAIENADPKFFPAVKAAFSYGAHSAARVDLGYAPGTFLKLPSSLPLLLMGGNCDGIMAGASKRYGIEKWDTPYTPVIRTFNEAIASTREDVYLLILEGASSFSFCDRKDNTLATSFLDFPPTQPRKKIHSLLTEAISLFMAARVCGKTDSLNRLDELLTTNNPAIAFADCK